MNHIQQLVHLILKTQALSFGQFTLKSGKKSPYFFNLGQINQAADLATLGQLYADKLVTLSLDFDGLFGPAYKGIPLACCTAMQLYAQHHKTVSLSYNRKEKKDHGESGHLVGLPEKGRLILIDDVITAGTAIKEVMQLVSKHSASDIVAIVVTLDRQEMIQGRSAAQMIQDEWHIPVYSLITLTTLMENLPPNTLTAAQKEQITNYQKQYG